jgi:hypothetical protein
VSIDLCVCIDDRMSDSLRRQDEEMRAEDEKRKQAMEAQLKSLEQVLPRIILNPHNESYQSDLHST